ncbi:PI-PLC domain-containing protein [Candidatus Solirubrobacter pratensis]|uniref:hypothetical protein n=1 Tax=Candidatus Solirubrobacter pratensis TaxID=1298857 RepID=UPI0003FF4077|nr:hypothetical protein [Candidatus Solirubrobacter pratensis]
MPDAARRPPQSGRGAHGGRVDGGTVAGAAIEKLRPDLAAKLEQGGRVRVATARIGSAAGDLARLANRVRVLSWLLAALTLAAGAAAIALALDRRRAIARLGVGAATAGVAIVVAYTAARAVVLAGVSDPDERAAAAGVWTAFLGDLRTLGWALGGGGIVVAAAADSLIRPVAIEGTPARAWRTVAAEPRSTPRRLARAAALIAAGAIVIAQPLTVVQVAAIVGGVYLVYKGLESALRGVYRPRPEHEPARRRRAPLAAVIVPAALLVAGSAGAFVAAGGAAAPGPAVDACNGAVALCDRPLDQVVLPATHNAMSAPLPGWASAEQDRSIGGQLEDGIRGLLVDTHYADRLPDGRVRTYFGTDAQLRRTAQQDGVSEASIQAALRLRERLGFRGEGERGMYLCHTFCELGATPLADALKDIHDFLATHPSDVVVVINQDYVTPADYVKAVGDAGLVPYAFSGDPATTTLGQMIDSGRRLMLLAENHAGAAPWYRLAYASLTEETPYTFKSARLLTDRADLPASCKANRGPAKAPLFLINHWVSTDPIPRPSDAAKVNAYAPLLARAQECERLRHHLPNLLAVNFYKRGDLFRVVDTLNRTVQAGGLK